MNTPWRQPAAPWPPPPPCARVLPLICFSRCLRTTNALNLCAPRGFSPWPAPPPCAPVLPLSLLFSVSPWLCGEYSLGCGYSALCLCTTNALSLCMPRGSSPWPPPPPCAPVLPLGSPFSVSLCLLRNKIYDCWKQRSWRTPHRSQKIGRRSRVSSPTRLAPQSKCSVVNN